jgi:radical SAM-linked protein
VNRRLRIRFSKTGKVRFTSHRDVARIWERALRRARLPIAYTEGFSPRPKLSFGLALPTGCESYGEYLDINLRADAPGADIECELLPALLDPALPVGMATQAVVPLEAGALSLQQAVTSCTWRIEFSGPATAEVVAAAAHRALAAPELLITRERKGTATTDDVRPAILRLDEDGRSLEAELATQPRALRPAEFVSVLEPALVASSITRLHQWTQADGARQEVIFLPAGATQAAHALERAS